MQDRAAWAGVDGGKPGRAVQNVRQQAAGHRHTKVERSRCGIVLSFSDDN